MSTQAQLKAQSKYDKDNTKQVMLKLNIKNDADILGKLDAVGNRQGYIKDLIRTDMKYGSDVLSEESISLLVKPIMMKYGIIKAYVFGSYARGEATAKSDIDILIEGGSMHNLFEYNNFVEELSRSTGRQVDIVMSEAMEKDNSRSGRRLREHVMLERKLIYG